MRPVNGAPASRLATHLTPGPAEGGGTTVLLVSGAGDSAASWLPVRRQLTAIVWIRIRSAPPSGRRREPASGEERLADPAG